jgi:hypothetical protein
VSTDSQDLVGVHVITSGEVVTWLPVPDSATAMKIPCDLVVFFVVVGVVP